jgi:hypothetical protein
MKETMIIPTAIRKIDPNLTYHPMRDLSLANSTTYKLIMLRTYMKRSLHTNFRKTLRIYRRCPL